MGILTVDGKVVLAGGKPIIPPQGGGLPQQEKAVTITKNGQTSVTPDDGKTLSKIDVTVAVPSDAKPEQTKTTRITANGKTKVLPDSGKVLSEVDVYVAVPSDAKAEEEKTVSITENGTTEITPTSGKVLSKVTANVNVPQPDIGQLSVTANGAYTAGKDVDAWNKVTVNVPQSGGGTVTPVDPSDITFIDYDGTVVAAWTLAELASKTALPDAPTHDGLIFQEWNYTLAELKKKNAQVVVGALYDTDDGSTRIYIHLEKGRTSPMFGCCPNGTATIDWGDGTALDTLTGSNVYTAKWTNTHEYAAPGDYVITISMSNGGTLGFTGSYNTNRFSSILRQDYNADVRNRFYTGAVRKIELGSCVTNLNSNAFSDCYALESIAVSTALAYILGGAFSGAKSLRAIVAGQVSTYDTRQKLFIGEQIFKYCSSSKYISMKISVGNIQKSLFEYCYMLRNIPDIVHSNSMTLNEMAFSCLYSITNIRVPVFSTISAQVFDSCFGMKLYDFTDFTSVPTLSTTDAFNNIPPDCEIRVPASLLDTWKAATNWATYADYIVGV